MIPYKKIIYTLVALIILFLGYQKFHVKSYNKAITNIESNDEENTVVLKGDLDSIFKQWIMDNPEVIVESVNNMKKKGSDISDEQMSEIIKSKKDIIERDPSSPILGKGNIPVVMFYDINCGYCKKMNQVINELLSQNHNVKVILKPMGMLNESSLYCAKLEIATYKLYPNKFKTIHDELMNTKINSREDIVNLFKKHKIDIMNLEAEFDSEYLKSYLMNIYSLQDELKIRGVPNIILNDKLYPGYLTLENIIQLLSD
jgi:protein-disulfide isomerase